MNKKKIALTAMRGTMAATGLFTSLFASPFGNTWNEPQGSYDSKKQLYVDATGVPLLAACSDDCNPPKPTYCSTSKTTAIGKGDDDTVYQACD